jgi:hypothetical protein
MNELTDKDFTDTLVERWSEVQSGDAKLISSNNLLNRIERLIQNQERGINAEV